VISKSCAEEVGFMDEDKNGIVVAAEGGEKVLFISPFTPNSFIWQPGQTSSSNMST
jgi:hypothetical protein